MTSLVQGSLIISNMCTINSVKLKKLVLKYFRGEPMKICTKILTPEYFYTRNFQIYDMSLKICMSKVSR